MLINFFPQYFFCKETNKTSYGFQWPSVGHWIKINNVNKQNSHFFM